jgi:hypothetical protein
MNKYAPADSVEIARAAASAVPPPAVQEAVSLVISLRERGWQISVDNGKIRVTGRTPLGGEDERLLRAAKAALVAIYEPPGACVHSEVCLHCGRPGTAFERLLPYGTGPLKWHLHPTCWPGWHRAHFPEGFEPV